MRILVLIYEFPPIGGGGGRVAQDLCSNLAQNGHDIRVLTADLGGITDNQEGLGFVVDRVSSWRREPFRAGLLAMGGYLLAGFLPARRMIDQWQPDLIHVHFAVPTGALAWLLSKIYKIPYILTIHLGDVPGGAPEKTTEWFRWIYPFTPPIWKDAAQIVAVSEYTRQLALKHYRVDIQVIPNGVDSKQLKPKKLVQNEIPRIVFAGRFVEQKYPLQLVRVLARLKNLPWECIMFGDGPMRDAVEKEIASNQLMSRILLQGWVDTKDILMEFGRSEILFMPSRSEGLPVVGLQALASGMAIVAGKRGGFMDLVRIGENGYLYDSDDAVGMSQGLHELITDSEKRLKMRNRSLEIAKRFDLRKIVSDYEELFAEVTIR